MQDLHSILVSISKEKLVDIIENLAEDNEEFKNQLLFLANKNDAQIGNNSADDRNFEQNYSEHENSSICKNEIYLETVSKKSSPQEKIKLFKSLFIGREDVFALRWFNAKFGKSGYSPVCENKWKSGKCDFLF